jgi:BolA protein
MESKNLDESIGMLSLTTQRPSLQVLTLRNPLNPGTPLTRSDGGRIAAIMNTKGSITNRLREAFSPESLEVSDESHLHEGHAGHRPGGETHFRVYIVSAAFEGKSRIERHRMINSTLAAELGGGVHALAIKAEAPGEAS